MGTWAAMAPAVALAPRRDGTPLPGTSSGIGGRPHVALRQPLPRYARRAVSPNRVRPGEAGGFTIVRSARRGDKYPGARDEDDPPRVDDVRVDDGSIARLPRARRATGARLVAARRSPSPDRARSVRLRCQPPSDAAGSLTPDDDDDDDDADSLPPLSNILPPAARCVLLRGDGAKALMPHLRWEMQSAGFEPAIFGAFTANNQDATIAKVASNVVEAHERHWRLSGDPGSDANVQEPTSPYAETPSSKALWATNTAWEGEEAWSPASAVPVLNVVTDAATVPDPPPFGVGDYFREDATAIVALDGVVGESLRGALLDAVTEPGWDHANAASPPTPKWDRSMTDGINGKTEEDSEEDPEEILIGLQSGSYGTFRPAPGSWGLTESALADVVSHPATATFLSRIAALYPDYHVRTMPADALEPDGVPGTSPGSSGRRIATAVANAAVYGDDFKWHLDADPVSFF